ncbi:hypothetical protein DKX38_030093 (mitochondrion) [Salix brachista]|uniref:Uncharacterized protein n=1 Tax=Salix brachista TaxID=2182728 RepID=A0A5N5IVD9_9ROSI|nr:hypothetical protein DKX38_030093 [Salix brachista]
MEGCKNPLLGKVNPKIFLLENRVFRASGREITLEANNRFKPIGSVQTELNQKSLTQQAPMTVASSSKDGSQDFSPTRGSKADRAGKKPHSLKRSEEHTYQSVEAAAGVLSFVTYAALSFSTDLRKAVLSILYNLEEGGACMPSTRRPCDPKRSGKSEGKETVFTEEGAPGQGESVGPDPSLAGSLHRPLESHHISQAQEKLKSAFFLGSHLPKVNFFNRFLSPTGLNLSYLYSRLAFVQGRHMLEGRIAVNDSSHTPTTTASEPFTATSLLSKPAMNIEPDWVGIDRTLDSRSRARGPLGAIARSSNWQTAPRLSLTEHRAPTGSRNQLVTRFKARGRAAVARRNEWEEREPGRWKSQGRPVDAKESVKEKIEARSVEGTAGTELADASTSLLLLREKKFTTRTSTRHCSVKLSPIAENSPLLPPVGVWAVSQCDHPKRPATDHRLGKLLPHQLANQTRAPPRADSSFCSSAYGTKLIRNCLSFQGLYPCASYSLRVRSKKYSHPYPLTLTSIPRASYPFSFDHGGGGASQNRKTHIGFRDNQARTDDFHHVKVGEDPDSVFFKIEKSEPSQDDTDQPLLLAPKILPFPKELELHLFSISIHSRVLMCFHAPEKWTNSFS